MNDHKKYPHINLMPFQWEPFNGDTHLQDTFIKLRDKHGIKKAIELGTCLGSTTIFLAENFDQVYSTEINPEFYAIADARLIDRNLWNVALYCEDSRSILDAILPHDEPAIVFIDSHWGENNPLIQELEIIRKFGNRKLILVIHDFKVPDHPELQFDTYPAQNIVYEWAWIEKSIERIYPDGYTKMYNETATGAKVGVIIIEPK